MAKMEWPSPPSKLLTCAPGFSSSLPVKRSLHLQKTRFIPMDALSSLHSPLLFNTPWERRQGQMLLLIKFKYTQQSFFQTHIILIWVSFPPSLCTEGGWGVRGLGGWVVDKQEICWQGVTGAKWIWVMGSWTMCLFNHLEVTPSVWCSAYGRTEHTAY